MCHPHESEPSRFGIPLDSIGRENALAYWTSDFGPGQQSVGRRGDEHDTLINVFTVEPANQQRLVDLLVRVTDEFVRQSPGFVSSTLRRDPRPLPFFEEALTLAKFDLGMYEVVRTFSPVGSR